MRWFEQFPPLSAGEARLEHDRLFAPWSFPADPLLRDEYFREGLALVRTVKNQPETVRAVISGYAKCASDPALRIKLDTFLQSLTTAVPPKKEEPR